MQKNIVNQAYSSDPPRAALHEHDLRGGAYSNGRKGRSGRLETLDLVRGITLVSMIIYHGMWDFLYLTQTGSSCTALRTWYEGIGGYLWQQSICRTFILLSGFCVPFSRNILRRGLQVSAGGALVSAVTILALYEDRVIFGVLTFLGAAMLVTGGLERLFKRKKSEKMPDGVFSFSEDCIEEPQASAGSHREKRLRDLDSRCRFGGRHGDGGKGEKKTDRINPENAWLRPFAGLAVCLLLFHVTRWINFGYLRLGPWRRLDLPDRLYTIGSGKLLGYIMTGLGFTTEGFFSTDYFSFIPWIFLFWSGLFLHRVLEAAGIVFDAPFFHMKVSLLNLIGRHSLLVYLLHQPVLYLLMTLLF